MAHRIAFYIHYGVRPPSVIDHIDGDKANNRISNLRSATPGQNSQNAKRKATSRSGVKGVRWHPRSKVWEARIRVQGRRVNIGSFKTLDAARIAIISARRALHGEFARHE